MQTILFATSLFDNIWISFFVFFLREYLSSNMNLNSLSFLKPDFPFGELDKPVQMKVIYYKNETLLCKILNAWDFLCYEISCKSETLLWNILKHQRPDSLLLKMLKHWDVWKGKEVCFWKLTRLIFSFRSKKGGGLEVGKGEGNYVIKIGF